MVTMNGDDASTVALLPSVAANLDDHGLDDDDDGMSDDSESFADCHDLMSATMEDEVTAQLAAAGPVGMAASMAIASAKKRKRPHQFETNPSIRKRQQTRLLRKLRQTIDEFTIRVGMQAVVLVAIPGKPQNSFKCFGAKPLEDVIRNLRPVVMQELEASLAQHAPAPLPEDPSLHELPPLVIDGIPTPVEKMTQAQLRAFIPLMLKYSTGRGKPGWGKESTRPPWWPQDLPWANVRMDARTEDEKQKVSWTHALRQIVINCYKYHGREDLLPVFNGESDEHDIKPPIVKIPKASPHINISTMNNNSTTQVVTTTQSQNQSITQTIPVHQFPSTVLQTISNPDGTVSIIQVDPSNSYIQLPDGTHAQVQGVATLQHSGDGQGGDGDNMPVTLDLNSVAQAALAGQEGQIMLTGEDGHVYPVTVSGMISVPMPSNMYQTVVANISSIQAQHGSDGTLQTKYVVESPISVQSPLRKGRLIPVNSAINVVSPMVLPKIEPGTEGETTAIPVSALTGDPTQTQVVHVNANGQGDKIYQICEFLKPENHEKVIMMAEVTNHQQIQQSHHHQLQQHVHHEMQGEESQQDQEEEQDDDNNSKVIQDDGGQGDDQQQQQDVEMENGES
ncbi:DNA-binding protein P3A2 isoform X2 [Folsomia candida]|uniref:DNA-binding protein P3A2 isoform X2 n=1 Tax=Folsomia candida TaxID=158441 RepID=UPI000B8F00DD|nr:DNA-binding protein P3A2 isoform X2 [Folsomia candida]